MKYDGEYDISLIIINMISLLYVINDIMIITLLINDIMGNKH